jgi:hypothetical protein
MMLKVLDKQVELINREFDELINDFMVFLDHFVPALNDWIQIWNYLDKHEK